MRFSITLAALTALCFLTFPAHADTYEAGKAAHVRGDYATALRIWRPLAEKGEADAQNGLAVLYSSGQGVTQDVVEAERLFRLSAAQGNTKAQGNLALHIFRGDIKGSYAEALQLARLAAEHGGVLGHYVLGDCYFRARCGIDADYEKALIELGQASALGYGPAQQQLGMLYASGLGTDEDRVRAYAWFKAALQNGPPGANRAHRIETEIGYLIERSTLDEIKAGEALAARCIKSGYQDCEPGSDM
jgi:TPR repeat protein